MTTLSGNRTHARALRAYQASMRSLVLACVFLSVIFFLLCVRWIQCAEKLAQKKDIALQIR